MSMGSLMVWLFVFWWSLFFIFYPYLGYPFLLVVLSWFKTARRNVDVRYTPEITMVIAVHNEEKVIESKIKNCLALNYPKSRIRFLFGSDGSTDGTDLILKKYRNDRIRCRFFENRRGKASVLNALMEQVRSDIVVFSDANTMYECESVRHLVRHFVDTHVGGVCGRLLLVSPNQSAGGRGEALYWDFENRLKFLEGKIKTVFGANGAIYAIRRNLFIKLPTDRVVMDDFLIPLRIVKEGLDVVYDNEAMGTETTSLNLRDEFIRKVRIGAANYNALCEMGSLLNPQKGFIAFGLWSHKVIRWFVPFFMIALFVSNVFLVETVLYSTFFILQMFFYGMVIGGWLVPKCGFKVLFISYFTYFAVIHFALLVGFFKFLFKKQKPAWTRLDR